jgi:hypothetical protein
MDIGKRYGVPADEAMASINADTSFASAVIDAILFDPTSV